MTPSLYWLIGLATVLSFAHHVDHVLRGATGWPLTHEFNPFTYSLLVYPVIGVGVVLSLRGSLGPRFWSFLSAGGALFVVAVHLGPVAGDAVADIPRQYASPLVGAVAVGLLAAFIVVLCGTFLYERRLTSRSPRRSTVGDDVREPGDRSRRDGRRESRSWWAGLRDPATPWAALCHYLCWLGMNVRAGELRPRLQASVSRVPPGTSAARPVRSGPCATPGALLGGLGEHAQRTAG